MRKFNGLQVFTQQLTNSGQLDLRYVRISGNDQPANIYFGNLSQDYSFFKNTNFNITKTMNIFYSDDGRSYTGYMPNVIDKSVIFIKNLSSSQGLIISGYASNQIFDMSDEVLSINPPQGINLIGVVNNTYTGWVNLLSSQGIS
jgi:hypothetical protein